MVIFSVNYLETEAQVIKNITDNQSPYVRDLVPCLSCCSLVDKNATPRNIEALDLIPELLSTAYS